MFKINIIDGILYWGFETLISPVYEAFINKSLVFQNEGMVTYSILTSPSHIMTYHIQLVIDIIVLIEIDQNDMAVILDYALE